MKQRDTIIAPSMMAADLGRLGDEARAVQAAGAGMIHMDVMDGHFVPNLTFGAPVVAAVRAHTTLPIDAHLMVTYPSDFVAAMADAGADYITFHLESCDDPADVIAAIKKHKKKVGIAIGLDTSFSQIMPYIPDIDLVLILGIAPGWAGQEMNPAVIAKIAETKALIGRKKILIAADGGINAVTAPAVRLAGADVLVAGYGVFKQPDYAAAVRALKG